MTSHGSGCMSALDGDNRHGLVSYLADAQYRTFRTYDGEVPMRRGMFRLLQAKLPNYSGPVLWVDELTPVRRNTPYANENKLLLRHALKKAAAMGVPLLTDIQEIRALAEQKGFSVTQGDVCVSVDQGNTGIHQSQGLEIFHYFINWPPHPPFRFVVPKKGVTHQEISLSCLRVMPRPQA